MSRTPAGTTVKGFRPSAVTAAETEEPARPVPGTLVPSAA